MISATIMGKLGVKQCMAIGAFFDAIWIICQIIPQMKKEEPDNASVFLSDSFIYFTVSFSSICDGLGNAIQWVA